MYSGITNLQRLQNPYLPLQAQTSVRDDRTIANVYGHAFEEPFSRGQWNLRFGSGLEAAASANASVGFFSQIKVGAGERPLGQYTLPARRDVAPTPSTFQSGPIQTMDTSFDLTGVAPGARALQKFDIAEGEASQAAPDSSQLDV